MNTMIRPALLTVVFLTAITLYFQGTTNSDFLAVYLAGMSYADGQFDQVYPAAHAVFDLSYPDSWDARAAELGVDADTTLYPFIYPPLWAAVSSLVAPHVPLSVVSIGLPLINGALLLACSILAWRITRTTVPVTLWLSVGFFTLVTTTYGYVALAQGQPQILTTFLILLAIERGRADAPLTAGACLALAASIKLYPLVFVVIWLATRSWRAVAGFAVAGAVLAGASIALTGWPLHQDFLAQIEIISGSVLVTPLSYNFSAVVTALTEDVFASGGGFSAAAPAALGLINKMALVACLVAAALAAHRATPQQLYCGVWPLLLIAVSFFSPMSWSYHFLTALAFAPLAFATDRVTPKLCVLYLLIASSIVLALSLSVADEATRAMILFISGVSSLAALTVALMLTRRGP
ncbi:uncharacterized protein DUF2029 [Litoreibacter ponti]|uniref:Uncharacterized protein DUF2029 n=1 Tax=Litoreibacter ponti TaxID=1510457 RepID=A0A2T6BLW0_9RHOB|nr:glycosyltransferase family 87 protein [Litoreibacter ponti]PTX57058.1 uncharacterized protein DUF2029 [Litoreibacter ponti]